MYLPFNFKQHVSTSSKFINGYDKNVIDNEQKILFKKFKTLVNGQ